MKTIATYTFKMPSHIPCALEYGAEWTEDFNDEDMKTLEKYERFAEIAVQEHRAASAVWSYGDESYFCGSPDFQKLAGDVIDATLTVMGDIVLDKG